MGSGILYILSLTVFPSLVCPEFVSAHTFRLIDIVKIGIQELLKVWTFFYLSEWVPRSLRPTAYEPNSIGGLWSNVAFTEDVMLFLPLACRCLMCQTERSDYLKQLVLSCINHCCEKLEKTVSEDRTLSEEQFSVEVIIECMRTSRNSQTQQQALILLTRAALKFPVSTVSSGIGYSYV